MSDSEIQKFENIINKHKEKKFNIGVVVHHHPILVGTPLIDDCPILNASNWIDQIKKNNQIKLIITGHVYNHYSIEIGENAKLETGFSSFSLFKKPGANENEDIIKSYGYKTYEFFNHSYKTFEVLLTE